jgi:hypothetical protein
MRWGHIKIKLSAISLGSTSYAVGKGNNRVDTVESDVKET